MFELQIENKLLKNNQVTAMHVMVAIILILLGSITSSIPSIFTDKFDNYLNTYGYILLSLGIAIMVITIFFNKRIIQTKYNKLLRYIEVIVLLSMLVYTLMLKWYLPFSYVLTTLLGIIFALVWEHHGKKDHYIKIDNEGVHIPRFLRFKILTWREVERILLKHGLITIDCRNNKLYQFQRLDKTVPDNLESFIQEKIEEHAAKYDPGWDG